MKNFKPVYHLILLLFLLSFLTALYTCERLSPTNISVSDMRLIAKKQNALLEQCFKEGNAEKLAALYADSAKLSPNGGDFVVGRENIKNFWAEDFKTSKTLEMTTHVLTTNGNRDVIYETGKTQTRFLYQDSVYTVSVKYINVWVRQKDGTYKLDIDFWNKDLAGK